MPDLEKQFQPDADGLLSAISKNVGDEMLRLIAAADCGEEVEENFLALQKIRDELTFPEPMGYIPAEVLELVRWSQPDNPSCERGFHGEGGYWMRAFCCTALLRATRIPWVRGYEPSFSNDCTTIQLILSLHELPMDFTLEAWCFFDWLLATVDRELPWSHVLAYKVAMLSVGLSHSHLFEDQLLVSLATSIAMNATDAIVSTQSADLPGLRRMVTGCQLQRQWEHLARRFLVLDLESRSREVRDWVSLIGSWMLHRENDLESAN